MIHDLVTTVFDNRIANTRGDGVECFVPRCAFPFSFATLTGAFEWIKNAIGICYLVECGWSLRAVASARTGMFRVPLKLLNFASDFIDVSEESTRRFTIETCGGNQRIMPLLPLRPRPRIELGPIIPPFLRRKRRQMTPARPRVESFFFQFPHLCDLWLRERHGLARLDVCAFEKH